jgi:hypothetical protein
MGRLKPIHLALAVGMSLFIPFFLPYSLSVDLSETVLPSSKMSFEDADDEDFSACQNEFKIPVPRISSNLLSPWTHFGVESRLFSSSLAPHTQIASVLRC